MTEAASVAGRWAGHAGCAAGELGAQQARWHIVGARRRALGLLALARRRTQGRGRARQARGRALGARPSQGYAFGALGLFLARFDSVFFLSQIFGHCS